MLIKMGKLGVFGVLGAAGRGSILALITLAGGCGGVPSVDSSEAGAQDSGPATTISRELGVGDSGPEVRALSEYLRQFGYFPNEELQRQYPAWRPLATAPADDAVFDSNTEGAVFALQQVFGLPQSGIVDAATRAVLNKPRCGVPDGIQPSDPSDKFAFFSSKWPISVLRWKLVGAIPSALPTAEADATQAFVQWSSQTSLTFIQTTGIADIEISFAPLGIGIVGQSTKPNQGGDITMNSARTWATGEFLPALMHEVGHALGLDHSSVITNRFPLMFPFGDSTSRRTVDDNTAISTLYDTWSQLPGGGCVQDIDVKKVVGQTLASVWATACYTGDTTIWKWEGQSWTHDAAEGVAMRIAVQHNGRPWAVTANGSIWRRTSGDVNSGAWQNIPGCARDIGADSTIWIIGCSAVGNNFRVERFNDSVTNPGFDVDPSGGAARRITVDGTGKPWVATFTGSTYRRSSSGLAGASWEVLEQSTRGEIDIGITPEGYAYNSSKNGRSISIWQEQPAMSVMGSNIGGWRQTRLFGSVSLPIPVPQYSVAIAGVEGGQILVVDSLGTVWTSFR